tara:strand:+ start:246 stop:467 length:222 start_codon:yes stop_codon:yes gene_type:complete
MAHSQAYSMKAVITNRSHWELIENYVAVEIAALVIKLQTCGEKDLKVLQGELAALRKIEALPNQLKNEQKPSR